MSAAFDKRKIGIKTVKAASAAVRLSVTTFDAIVGVQVPAVFPHIKGGINCLICVS